MKKIILILLSAWVLSGCATNSHVGVDTSKDSNVNLGLYMAKDFSKQLATYNPPAHTQICLDGLEKRSFYEKQMVASLRSRGYAIGCPGVSIVTNMDRVENGFIATYTIGNKVLSRAYKTNGQNTFPISSWATGGL